MTDRSIITCKGMALTLVDTPKTVMPTTADGCPCAGFVMLKEKLLLTYSRVSARSINVRLGVCHVPLTLNSKDGD